ncbi:hypothetical protein B0A52_05219 [Exophiala mesophila]|uniref:Uncharacterized protein n=1 Tax=Exophiala mesophila TaxID=212818 RepID=A0A438N4U6_EXOME|nr:hypothetical protein B0A52_05219 [Exophiala mesophila]
MVSSASVAATEDPSATHGDTTLDSSSKPASPTMASDGEKAASDPTSEAASGPQPSPTKATDAVTDPDVDADAEADSEAETLIQSPEKQRLTRGGTSATDSVHLRSKDDESPGRETATDSENKSRKRKRSLDHTKSTPSPSSSRHSSPLSSPRIPIPSEDSDSELSSHIELHNTRSTPRKRSSHATADSEDAQEKPQKIHARRRRPSETLSLLNKNRSKPNSALDSATLERRETRSATYPRHSSNERSPSPKPPARREHRRGVSTQFTVGDVERKKRGRPPAIATRRSGSADHRAPSPSSDASDSPQNRQPTSRKYSSHDYEAMSPAKAIGPRKIRDKNGRTLLSKACNNGDLASAKARFAERPEDLNMADNAGNTPLQIASLMGYENVVKWLLESDAEVNTRNIDKDTPLIDAVENGHVEVVRLLLQHGANPRLGNAKGDEPYELVPSDDPNYIELRKLLADARENTNNRRVSSDQVDLAQDRNSSRAASAASPRDSPPVIGPRSPPNLTQRRRTGRSESTRNDLLWQASTQDNLTRLAEKGDVQGVANILNILQKAEPASLIAAAKGGHEEVLQFLLGMGDPDPDPEPLRHMKTGYNTPILAAIGRGHPEVVKLLVEQSGFNPSRRVLKGKTYQEIAAERRGDQWQKEVEILKAACDLFSAGKPRKGGSPRVTRDSEKAKSRVVRRSQSPVSSKTRNSTSSSPTLTHKSLPNKSPQSSQKARDRDTGSSDTVERRKTHLGRRDGAAEFSVAVISDQEKTVNAPRKSHPKRRSQSDLPQSPHLDSDSAQRRRRLVTGKEHRRRKSTVEEESDLDDNITPKTEPKPNTALKRSRDSVSPPPTTADDGELGRSAAKKRRTVIESSPEDSRPGPKRRSNQLPSLANQSKAETEPLADGQDHADLKAPGDDIKVKEGSDIASTSPKPSTENGSMDAVVPADGKIIPEDNTPRVKSEPIEAGPTEAELELQRQEEKRKAEEAQKLEEERIAAEKAAEEKRLAEEKRVAEEKRIAEEAERQRKRQEEEAAAAAALAAAIQRQREEDERAERLRREDEERLRRLEEAKRQRLEAERIRREALPIVLCQTALMIDNNDPVVRSESWLRKFLPLFTVKSSQLGSNALQAPSDDLWVPSFQVAGLLATKDLTLRSFTSLETKPVTFSQRQCLWKVARVMLSYEYDTNCLNTSIKDANRREEVEGPRFYAMNELFWVKLSDFEEQISRHPHLASLRLQTQPISLRIFGVQPRPDITPQTNGFSVQPPPRLTNGIATPSHPLYSNGYAR